MAMGGPRELLVKYSVGDVVTVVAFTAELEMFAVELQLGEDE